MQYVSYYNQERPHSGKYCFGKTPYQTFLDSKKIAPEKLNEKMYFHDQNLYIVS